MKSASLLLPALISLLVSLSVSYTFKPSGTAPAPKNKETAYERVMRTGVLRCGYWNWYPLLKVDNNTKEISGIFYDYMHEVGKLLDVKIEWAEELGYGDFYLGIQAGRVDAMCGGVWPLAARARVMEFTEPLFYLPLYFYTKTGDQRFDNNIKALNAPTITLTSMDGLVGTDIINKHYPQANVIQLTDKNSVGELFDLIITGKADATLHDPITAHDYMANNPGKIRQVISPYPITQFGNTVALNKGEYELKRMLDIATQQLQASGTIEEIIKKHEAYAGFMLRPALPYQPAP